MPREKPIIPIKTYGEQIVLPKVRRVPTVDDQVQELKAKNTRLEYELGCALDRIRRYREVVKWECEFWEAGLKNGIWEEGYTALKRRLSRLAGALEYPGAPGGANWIEKDR